MRLDRKGLLVGFVLITGSSVLHRFERAAADDIRASLASAPKKITVRAVPDGPVNGLAGMFKSVEIRASGFSTPGLPMFTEPDRSQKGQVQMLRIALKDFMLGKLRVESLTAEIPDCRFDLALALSQRKFRLSRSGSGVGSVIVRQEDIQSFILAKFREIKSCVVTIQYGKVRVKGSGDFLLAKADFEVLARVESPDGNALMLVDEKIWLNGRRADAFSRKALLKTLNPVLDLRKDLGLYDAMKVDKIVLTQGTLTASGVTKIPDLPMPQK